MRVFTALTVLAALAQTALANTQTAEAKLRRLMADARFLTMVFPCTVGGAKRNSPSEWIRTAFHDAADYNAAAGTGGIDGSIRFEVDYPANAGTTFSTSMTEFTFYQQDDVALADIVALAAKLAVGACQGPDLPFSWGRIDATQGGGEGLVPEPQMSTETHVEMFARMGFTPKEMITLVACGHTMGGVHGAVNPTITTETYHHFDDTHTVFDNRVAIQFVNDTRQNPLAHPVDEANIGISSDTRIFALDNNATIKSYAEDENAMMNDCKTQFTRMLNAVPAAVSLKGPITPFPVSGTFWQSTINGKLSISSFTASARLWNMEGQWKSFEVGYSNRDGSEGTGGAITTKAVRTISNGYPIEVIDFGTATNGVPPSTGISSINIKVTLNDGTVYSSAEQEEVLGLDDSVLLDTGNLYTCKYSGEANNYATGLNVTVAVLAPYTASDNVEVIIRDNSMGHTYFAAKYVGARDAYYNLYNVFIPDWTVLDFLGIGAKVTRADGSVSRDTKDDAYYRSSVIKACVGTNILTLTPIPSAAARRRSAARRGPAAPCPSAFTLCGDRCVNTMTNIEHCGGCAGVGSGVDCTTLSDGFITCLKGKCVPGELLP